MNLLRRPTRAALWLLVPIGFFVWAVASLWPHTIDDTYIYVLYAKNQVEGNGLVFNLGQRVDAMSNYLWVLVMALGGHLGAPILGWAKAVSAVLSTAQLVLAWWLTRLAIDATLGEPVAPAAPKPRKKGKKKKGDAPEPPPPAPDAAWFWRDALACLTPAMMVLQPGTAYYSANGLGTPLFTLLTLLGVALHQLLGVGHGRFEALQALHTGAGFVPHGGRAPRHGLLRQVADPHTRADVHLPAAGGQLPGERAEQGGLAGAVSAHEADVLAFTEMPAGVDENVVATGRERTVGEAEHVAR